MNANLYGATVSNADLNQANLTNANLAGANLTNVNFGAVQNLSSALFSAETIYNQWERRLGSDLE